MSAEGFAGPRVQFAAGSVAGDVAINQRHADAQGCEAGGESNLARSQRLTIHCSMLDWKDCPAVERSPDKVSGAWVFRGTRVPVRALFENLEAGAKVDDFLAWFEGVTRAQVDAVLEHASASLTTTK